VKPAKIEEPSSSEEEEEEVEFETARPKKTKPRRGTIDQAAIFAMSAQLELSMLEERVLSRFILLCLPTLNLAIRTKLRRRTTAARCACSRKKLSRG
jgi:hypothetical protein